ncbi:hypothetical protein GRF59_04050 [Paenibacillus sp. HJL G12]|uniref:B box-type domain-containing protein n=1 Tax=Paenibacillus dendrobii TaxID=2691084 RepID=A0A7X3IG21_9BACL|nr:B-box zinc finger protein [Paenibacillus dendrobii]MWV42791.1 hypothetical protein [Paenibacillus dendrobii]
MEDFRCMNHSQEPAVAQCRRCGKPVCEHCYDPETGCCRDRCGVMNNGSSMPYKQRSTAWTIVVSLLAIVGGLALLLITICGALIFSY